MLTRFLFPALLSFLSFFSYAQNITISGTITDSKNQQPVPFATLGIKGKNIGTVADENGVFNFIIDSNKVSAEENLIVSSIGYEPSVISLTKFKAGKQNISLVPSSHSLQTVTIKPQKYKTKVFGRTSSSTMMTANMYTEQNHISDVLGKEQATIISIDKNCFIRDFNMNVASNRFQSVKFRLNFYSVKNGLPDQLIVDKDIQFDVTEKHGWVKVDLMQYNIFLTGYNKVAVGIQWIKSVRTDTTARSFSVSVMPVPLHSMFSRDKSQAEWKKISPAYLGFNITADSFKPGKNTDNDKQTDDSAEQTNADAEQMNVNAGQANAHAGQVDVPADQTGLPKEIFTAEQQQIIKYAKYSIEAQASGYGNNSKNGNYITLNNAKIYYETYGQGEPLLLLHGNSQSISAFYQQIPVLAKSYRVIAVDTRGQGKSTDTYAGPLSYHLFAEDMKTLLDTLHIKQAYVSGWSDGGNTGLAMAVKYPEYVKGLAISGANLSPSGVDTVTLNSISRQVKELENNTDANSVKIRRLLTLLLTEPQMTTDELAKIKAPVLVIAGDQDVIKSEHTKEIAANIKKARLMIFKDATHYVPQEKPKEFNAAIVSFFK